VVYPVLEFGEEKQSFAKVKKGNVDFFSKKKRPRIQKTGKHMKSAQQWIWVTLGIIQEKNPENKEGAVKSKILRIGRGPKLFRNYL
jgi:hypothetical protein